jgi:hypothetical protein
MCDSFDVIMVFGYPKREKLSVFCSESVFRFNRLLIDGVLERRGVLIIVKFDINFINHGIGLKLSMNYT